MAAGIDWFRWHHGSVTDPKFQLVARRAGASLPDVIAIWAALLETASQSSPRGSIASFDPEAYDVLFNFPEPRTAEVLEALAARGIIRDTTLGAWEKRQPKREREADDSTERVREHRRRKKQAATETPRNATETKETPREEKSREEVKASLAPARADAPDDAAPDVVVLDGATGLPSTTPPSALAALTPAQAKQAVLACTALRKMGAPPRIHPGDEVLAALMAEGFNAEQVVRVVGEKALRDAALFNDPFLDPELPELLINGAKQQAMGLTDTQHTALRSAVAQVSIGYIAATLRGRRRDATQPTGTTHGKSTHPAHGGSGAPRSAVERVKAANAAAERREAAAGGEEFALGR